MVVVALMTISPSPALAQGPFRVLLPVVAVALVALLWRGPTATGSLSRSELSREAWFGLPLVGLALAAFVSDQSPLERGISRLLIAAIGVATLRACRREPKLRRPILKGVGTGAVLLSGIIGFVSVTGIDLLNAGLRPTRDFLLPLGLPKTSGVPKSFGELALIFGGGLSAVRIAPSARVRRVGTTVILSGALIAQSRNVLLVMLTVSALLAFRRRLVRHRILLAPLSMLAFVAPAGIAPAMNLLETTGHDIVIGEGIYRDNVRAREDHVSVGARALSEANMRGKLLGVSRTDWTVYSASTPHNHYVSLAVFDGLMGMIAIVFVWMGSVWRGIRWAQSETDLLIWISALGVVIGLSFYEGYFSAPAVLIVGMAAAVRPAPAKRGSPASALGPVGHTMRSVRSFALNAFRE